MGRTSIADFCHIPICIEGVSCMALVDTGSTVTVVRPEVVPVGTRLEDTAVQLRTVTGELAPMKARGQLMLTVGGRNMRHTVWVAEVQDACILGLDFLREQGCLLDLGRATLSFSDGQVVHMRPLDPRCTTTLTAGPHGGRVGDGEQGNRTRAASSSQLGPKPATRSLDSSAGLQTAAEERGERRRNSNAKRTAALREVWQRSAGDLDADQQEQLWQLLMEFRGCFSCDEEELGQTSLVQHTIDTGDAVPIRQRPRRLPLGRQDAAEQALVKMQRAGIIEPSESPWASPVVMVPKKGGEWRFCVDYRRLNGVTKKDSYPLPRVDECLDLVAGSTWFSSLDLRSGYWQVPLAEEARAKTAFCTGKGLWQFKVLCFGLCNAPATFERLMERVLAGVPHTECLVFLDDILAHGSSFEAAMAALRKVMERIKGAGLKLHPDKCRLLCRELTFLGHRIGSEGIGTVEEKVRAVREWPTPTEQKGLKSFLGLASYYRKFVRGFSGIAAPLYRLLQKDQPFVWAGDCRTAFRALQEALSSAPILAAPDTELPFVLDTDASGEGVGAVLSQAWPEGERVVAYYSKALSKAERRYCVTRRELLAVVFAVRHFKYYLCGRPFTIRTDHASLQWLMTFREPEGQLARWLEELQGCEFTVTHRAGERHGNADALSRRPCHADGCRYCDRRDAREQDLVLGADKWDCEGCEGAVMECRELQVVDSAVWAAEQQRDPDLQPVMLWVEAQQRPPWEEVAALSPWTKGLWAKFSSLRLLEGVLQRAWQEPATGEKRWQVVVPRRRQEAVLQAMHGAAGSGHFGVTKTLRRVRQAFYWGRLRRDVEDFCRCCDLCTARKGPPGRSRAQLQQFPVGEPMQRLGVDVLGPLPLTERGNRYILAAVDYFTKWPEAYALKDQEAETIVDALVEGIISRLGVPESIHSDQGRNFESRIFATMCTRLGITKTRTTPLHPQSDGLVERFNRTMGEQLSILTTTHQRDWDMHLPLVLMACRTAIHDSTSCTPALLMLGRELRTPAELAFGRPPDAPLVPAGAGYARRLQDRLDSAHAYARRQMRSAGVRQKRNYDLRAKGRHFAAGELVWTYSPKRKKGRCPKLDSHWVGPCRVLERLGEVVYRVQLPGTGRKVALHRDRLAPYRGSAFPQAEGGGGETTLIPVLGAPNEAGGADGPGGSACASPARSSPRGRSGLPEPGHRGGQQKDTTPLERPRRRRRTPLRLKDFVLGDEDLREGGVM